MDIMDLNSFLDEMDHDDDVVSMIITELINALKEQIPQMTILLENRDYEVLSREAHSIKGGARNVMAEGLEYCSVELEKAVLAQDNSNILKFIEELKYEFKRFKDFAIANLQVDLS